MYLIDFDQSNGSSGSQMGFGSGEYSGPETLCNLVLEGHQGVDVS